MRRTAALVYKYKYGEIFFMARYVVILLSHRSHLVQRVRRSVDCDQRIEIIKPGENE